MREVRMTFGEHLDELRTRVIHSLVYLVGAVIVCFSFGDELMRLAKWPHEDAIRNAQRDRLIARMVGRLELLDGLVRGDENAGLPLSPGEVRWEVLFAHEIASAALIDDVREPFDLGAESIRETQSFTAEQAQELAMLLRSVGEQLAEKIVVRFSPSRLLGLPTDFLASFEALDTKLGELEDQLGSGEAERFIGIGRGIAEVREPLQKFTDFLTRRREEAKRRLVSLADLESRVASSELPAYLFRVLSELESDVREVEDPDTRLMTISYLENFMVYMKISLIFGLGLALPLILYEMWKFVGSGLYTNEQKYVVIFMPFSLLLFAAGVMFGYFAMIPIGLRFLASWGSADVNLSITLENYVGIFLTMTLILGLVFQIPLVMIFLTKIDVVTVSGFRRLRKPAIFVLFCGAAVITPPDPITLLLMAGPLVGLYEVGIIVSAIINRQRDRQRAREDKKD